MAACCQGAPGQVPRWCHGQPRSLRRHEHAARRAPPPARPDPGRRARPGPPGGVLGTHRREHAALADHRGAQSREASRPWPTSTPPSGRRTPSSAGAGPSASSSPPPTGQARAHAGRRRLPRRRTSTKHRHPPVHRRPGDDGHHRQEPRPDLHGRRRLGLHRGRERHAGVRRRGPRLHPHHAALHPRAGGEGRARHPRELGHAGDGAHRLPGRPRSRPDHPAAAGRSRLRRRYGAPWSGESAGAVYAGNASTRRSAPTRWTNVRRDRGRLSTSRSMPTSAHAFT